MNATRTKCLACAMAMAAGMSWATTRQAVNEAEILGALADTSCDVIELTEPEYTLTKMLEPKRAVTIRGSGWRTCVMRQTTQNYKVAYLQHASARIEGVTMTGAHIWSSSGGGLRIASGTAYNCRITGNTSASGSKGSGVYMTGGTLSHCIVDHNGVVSTQPVAPTSAGVCIEGNNVTIESCLIVRNNAAAPTVSGDKGCGAGVFVYNYSGVKILNTTIADNIGTGGAAGLFTFGNGVTVRNCIVARNVASDIAAAYQGAGGPNWYAPDADTWARNVSNCLWGDDDGCQCIGSSSFLADPAFTDEDNEDYTLTATSKAVGHGVWYEGIPPDLDGAERLNPPDMGCYQSNAPRPLSCAASFGPATVRIGSDVSFTATVSHATQGAVYDYTWTLTGRAGNKLVFTGNNPELTAVVTVSDDYLVVLSVVNRDNPDDAAMGTAEDRLLVVPATCYVTCAPGAVPISPFATPETAATKLADALAVAGLISGTVVSLDAGTHQIPKTVTLDSSITLRGAGREKTVLRPSAKGYGLVILDNPAARLEDMTLADVDTSVDGDSCVNIKAGGGTVVNCLLTRNIQRGVGRNGGALRILSDDGLADRCIVSCNTNYNATSIRGVIFMTKGVLRNTIVCDNRLEVDNPGYSSGSIVYVNGAATLENCTVVNNVDFGRVAGAVFLGSGGSMRNIVMAGNSTPNVTPSASNQLPNFNRGDWSTSVMNCCYVGSASTLDAGSFTAEDAGFVNAAAGNYRLRADSPCRKHGLVLDWMEGSLDVYGTARKGGGKADIGAATYPAQGLVIFFR